MKIKGCVAVVAGGGSGLGAQVCRYLAEHGAKVVVLDKSEKTSVIATETKGLGIICDITTAKPLEKAFDHIQNTLKQPVSILVNCAGIAPAQRMVGKSGPVDLSWFSDVININLIGTFNVMRLAADQMSKNEANSDGERGVIINTASIAAFDGQIGQMAYSASKGGIVAMTLPAARELARFGIRVMTIAPGLMDTPMLQGMTDEVKESLLSQTVFPKRLGNPKEFAECVGHIISNSLLNGEVIRLDGAIRMGAH